jgi:hypothetical protein
VGGLIFAELRGAGYLSSFASAGAERLPVFPYSAFMLTDRDVAHDVVGFPVSGACPRPDLVVLLSARVLGSLRVVVIARRLLLPPARREPQLLI